MPPRPQLAAFRRVQNIYAYEVSHSFVSKLEGDVTLLKWSDE